MRTLKVLHLASFDGNIGDNANHNGVRFLWKKYLPEYDFAITPLEMREYFWKWKSFDDDFADMVNEYDLFVCGGGNYFELWVQSSPTGTSVAIPLEVLRKIKTPCLFYALGLDPYMGAPDICIERFKRFLDYTLASPQFLVSVRNDGSLDSARRVLGGEYADRIHLMPDGGHFVQPEACTHYELTPGARTIGVNLAGDMLDFRFKSCNGKNLNDFKRSTAAVLCDIMRRMPDVNLIFYPHIHKDYSFLADFICGIDDHLLRRRITVAPYLHGQGAERKFFDLYRQCALNIGTRLHANICSVGLKTPSIGIVTHEQIHELYGYYGMAERALRFSDDNYAAKLDDLIFDSLENTERISCRYSDVMSMVTKDAERFLGIMNCWLDSVV
jgi:hypothetical protein